jgi:hypothetical protein
MVNGDHESKVSFGEARMSIAFMDHFKALEDPRILGLCRILQSSSLES